MNLTLIRDTNTADYTQGVMSISAVQFQSIERPWVDGSPGKGGAQHISCVPPGVYDLALHDTELHPRSFALVNPELDVYHEPGDVPGARVAYARTAILIHIANTAAELMGCIGLGMSRSPGAVSSSAIALSRFRLLLGWVSGHTLTITQAAWQ